jgi:tight adherence protein C
MTVIILLIVVSIYLILYQFKFINPNRDEAHLSSGFLKDNPAQEVVLPKASAPGSLRKSWLPLTSKFKTYEQRISNNNLRRRIVKAGSPLGVLEFFAFKLISVILIPLIGFIFFASIFPRKDIALVVFLAIGYLLPEIWLNNKIKKRQQSIRRDLPNAIDLLGLCVSGGLDFMLAVSRLTKDLKPSVLTTELSEIYYETQLGKTRREALKNFAWRVDIPEVHSFVRTLVQADRMGTPTGDALKMQSEEMRVLRFQNGEAMALKAPIKLLLPLFAFILPVVIIIVGAPVILEFMRNTGKIGF